MSSFLLHAAYLFLALSLQCFGDVNIFECGHNVVNINASDYFMFQTPSYPSYWYGGSSTGRGCLTTFIRTDVNSKLWFVLFNGYIDKYQLTEFSSDMITYESKTIIQDEFPPWFSYFTKYHQLQFYSDLINNYAFQAFFNAPDSTENESCPMNGKEFKLSNNYEIIPIASTFNYPYPQESDNILTNCSWTFNVPNGYKLKINLKLSNIGINENLIVTTSNQKSTSLKTVGAYYFEGTKFTIKFIRSSNNNASGFGALVTAVKSKPNISMSKCHVEGGGYIEPTYGNTYYNDFKCIHQIQVYQPFSLNCISRMEKNVDTLFINDSFGNQMDLITSNNWIIEKDAKNVTLNFEADGSITNYGFQAFPKNLNCICPSPKIILPCNFTYMSSLTFGRINGDDSYCSNMICNFTLSTEEKCKNISFILRPKIQLRQGTNDIVIIYNKGVPIQTYNSVSKVKNHYIFEAGSNIFIQFKSGNPPSKIYPAPTFSLWGTSLTNFTKSVINLTPENYSYTVDLRQIKDKRIITVNAPKGYELDLYVVEGDPKYSFDDLLNGYHFYESDSLLNYIGTIADLPRHPKYNEMRYYNVNSQVLTMFVFNKDAFTVSLTLHYRLRKSLPLPCTPFPVIPVTNTTTTIKSSNNESCIITLLNYYGHGYGHPPITQYIYLKTDAVDNVKLISETDPKYTFFEFNKETASTWKNLVLYGFANSFIVPANSTLIFLSLNPDYSHSSIKDTFTSKGIVTSLSFTNQFLTDNDINKVYLPNGINYKFTSKFLDLSSNAVLTIGVNGSIQKIDRVNQSIILKTLANYDPVYINLTEPENGRRGYVFEYEIFTSNNNGIMETLQFSILFACFAFYFCKA